MVPLARGSLLSSVIRSARCVIVCGSLVLAQLAHVSCNHVGTTNVNSSAPNVNASPTPQDLASLKAKVEALEKEPLGPSSLGSPIPSDTSNVTEIIAEGDRAVPFLVEALNQQNKPVLVGYAAYCLRRIKTDKGKEPAIRLYKKYYARRSRLTDNEPFAFNQLALYLSDMSAVPAGMQPAGD